MEAAFRDLEEKLQETEKVVEARERHQKLLNEGLLDHLKKLVGRELFSLLESREFNAYSDTTSTECTDQIIVDLISHTESVKQSLEAKCSELSNNYKVEKSKHQHYKAQLIATTEELKLSQEEIENLLTNLSKRIKEENGLRKTIEEKKQVIEELKTTIVELQDKTSTEAEDLAELKQRILQLKDLLEAEQTEVTKLNQELNEVWTTNEKQIKETSLQYSSRNTSRRLENTVSESEPEDEPSESRSESDDEELNESRVVRTSSTANNSKTNVEEQNLRDELLRKLRGLDMVARDYDKLAPIVDCLVPVFRGGKRY